MNDRQFLYGLPHFLEYQIIQQPFTHFFFQLPDLLCPALGATFSDWHKQTFAVVHNATVIPSMFLFQISVIFITSLFQISPESRPPFYTLRSSQTRRRENSRRAKQATPGYITRSLPRLLNIASRRDLAAVSLSLHLFFVRAIQHGRHDIHHRKIEDRQTADNVSCHRVYRVHITLLLIFRTSFRACHDIGTQGLISFCLLLHYSTNTARAKYQEIPITSLSHGKSNRLEAFEKHLLFFPFL